VRFVFDTSVLVDYLRDDGMAADALAVAAEKGNVFVSLISFMELWLSPNKSNAEIKEEIAALKELCEKLAIRIVPCTHRSQQRALALLEHSRSLLGKNALSDSLIIATGMTRRAYSVTRDNRWFDVARSVQGLRVLSPEKLVEEL